jgi:hypothetical protein
VKEWLARRRKRKYCFHHDKGGNPSNSQPAVSWIKEAKIDTGMRKMFWCSERLGGCGKTWIP